MEKLFGTKKYECPDCHRTMKHGYVKSLNAFTYFCPHCEFAIIRTPLRPEDFGLKAKGKIKPNGWKHTIMGKK